MRPSFHPFVVCKKKKNLVYLHLTHFPFSLENLISNAYGTPALNFMSLLNSIEQEMTLFSQTLRIDIANEFFILSILAFSHASNNPKEIVFRKKINSVIIHKSSIYTLLTS